MAVPQRQKKTAEQKKSRVKRSAWLDAALEAVERGGVEAVRVDHLASELGVAKTSFYWHFRDRQALLDELLDYWSQIHTTVVTTDEELNARDPESRLRIIIDMIARHGLTRYDLAMRSWAQHDPTVAEKVDEVYDIRLGWVGRAFRELGFEGDDLEVRTRLYVCYQSWESTMFWKLGEDERARLAEKRLELLLAPAPVTAPGTSR